MTLKLGSDISMENRDGGVLLVRSGRTTRGPALGWGREPAGERRSRQHGGVAKITGDVLMRL